MKSILNRISLILILSFIVQVGAVSLFYRHVVVNRIITEINEQESNRQLILRQVIQELEKVIDQPEKVHAVLNRNAVKYQANFTLNDLETDVNYLSEPQISIRNPIKEHGYIRQGKKMDYIIYGQFTARMKSFNPDTQQQTVRVVVTLFTIVISIMSSILIYKTVASPLKKLSAAVKSINYGNTLVHIPYNAEDEFGVLCRNFEEMGRRLNQSEEGQQQLIQAISHDIKTPLTAIIGYSKRLVDHKVSENRMEEYHSTIYRRAEDLKALLSELDDYVMINVAARYNITVVNCKAVLEQMFKEFQEELQHSGATLIYDNKCSADMYIEIDIFKVKRVISNIIENSLKYAGKGCHIRISAYATGSNITLNLSDNGPGIRSDQLTKIFERFYRLDSSRSRDSGGTGLGLAICKEIIEHHGGEIHAANMDGDGLCISFTLPAHQMT